jgi:type 1 fimbriae regulatory protein FimB/type 1 fimbriae regulatory protein FimE
MAREIAFDAVRKLTVAFRKLSQNLIGAWEGVTKRKGSGYALANAGHDTRALQAWLGHRNIQHTVRYSELAPDRFRNFRHS